MSSSEILSCENKLDLPNTRPMSAKLVNCDVVSGLEFNKRDNFNEREWEFSPSFNSSIYELTVSKLPIFGESV